MDTISIKIDNKNFQVEKGTTILDAAKSVGINIPTLCYMNLHDLNTTHNPTGCRVCVVEVVGRKNLAPACA
ncbi:2Fe-2S iron-sulfur cluster binding domain-containing protein, partial [Flavobacterium bomense]